MKYHPLVVFFCKLDKMSQYVTSAAVVTGTLMVNILVLLNPDLSFLENSVVPHQLASDEVN